MNKIHVTAKESGERIDALLAQNGLTRAAAQRLLESGYVTLRGAAVKKSRRTEPGEVYEVCLPEAETVETRPQAIPLEIVYEDGDVIVVNKPRGLVVHPAPGHPDGTLVNALLGHCGDSLSGIGGEKRPGIVHRLDKDTSGLIIAAKNDFAHLALSAQLSDRSLSRLYDAVVWGGFSELAGTVCAPIGRHPADRKRMRAYEPGRNPAGAREAVTHWEVEARYNRLTHIRCRLQTGRTHQIRVHMAHIGHPVLGDMLYGHKKAEMGLEGQCLHARELRFRHPRTGETIRLASELPAYFADILARLGAPLL
jgi:23S rRNA pseudouridine1911/1915/1917 synthase